MNKTTTAIEARPYRMKNQIQNYAWGTQGTEAFIPQLLGIAPRPDTPYAELWMGAHPKAPSRVELEDERMAPLDQWIAAHPMAMVGHAIADSHVTLPFLFKVLSAGQALSIQAHPSKGQAMRLHKRDPEHYPDANHKPEIAIALDALTALVGFKPYTAFVNTLSRYPELRDFLGDELMERAAQAQSAKPIIQTTIVREVFARLIQRAADAPLALGQAVDALARRLAAGFEQLDEAEALFLELREQYGNQDVGLFALFLFNLVHLEAGEAIFTSAGVPHAYLKGNIIECMANSDNVVRVGLTPKFRDAKTLLQIVDPTPRTPEILDGNPRKINDDITIATYETPTPEFTVSRWQMPDGSDVSVAKRDTPAILLVAAGRVEIIWDRGHARYDRGETAFLPACLSGYVVKASTDAELFLAGVGDPGIQPTIAEGA